MPNFLSFLQSFASGSPLSNDHHVPRSIVNPHHPKLELRVRSSYTDLLHTRFSLTLFRAYVPLIMWCTLETAGLSACYVLPLMGLLKVWCGINIDFASMHSARPRSITTVGTVLCCMTFASAIRALQRLTLGLGVNLQCNQKKSRGRHHQP